MQAINARRERYADLTDDKKYHQMVKYRQCKQGCLEGKTHTLVS
jgi:hypothetical protein